jgi:hypothetical protein
MAKAKEVYSTTITRFDGGLSDSPLLGIKGSFYDGVGVDFRTIPGAVTAHQRLKKDSGDTVTELCKFAVSATDENSYWFSNESGKIWRRTSAGIWSLLMTNTNGACVGACEFNDYLYYATTTKLGRYGPLSGSPSASHSWQDLNSAAYHPMCVQLLNLVVGNDTTLATVDDAGTFTSNGTSSSITFLSLPPAHSIRCLVPFNGKVLVGTYTLDSSSRAFLLNWDITKQSFDNDSPELPHNIIQAIIPGKESAYVIAGSEGVIYSFNGTTPTPVKRIPGSYSTSSYLYVYPGSFADLQGWAMFGVSNGTGNPVNQGIYSLGQRDKNYPFALNLDYPISTGDITDVEVGAMLVIGKDILCSRKRGGNYGVDIVDWDNKYSSAYLTTLAITGNRFHEKKYTKHILSYKSLPTATALTLKYLKNFSTTEEDLTLEQRSENNKYFSKTEVPQCAVIQYKIGFTTNANDAPQLESMRSDYEEEVVI